MTEAEPDASVAQRAAVVSPRLLDVSGAASYLGCSRDTIRRLIDAGHVSIVRLPAARQRHGTRGVQGVNRLLLIDRVELDELVPKWREKRGDGGR